MIDIVERLRDKNCCDTPNCNCDEAADTITALHAENEKLRAALKDCIEVLDDLKWNTGAVERARAALEKEPEA